jgi:hypothetical protein
MAQQFYPLLKLQYPQPISLYRHVHLEQPEFVRGPGTVTKRIQLADLLHEWMGPKYRLASWHSVGFLNKDVYGEVRGHRENMLEERWSEYWSFSWFEKKSKSSLQVLPCPRGMGEDWYEAAEKFVEELFGDDGAKKYSKEVHGVRAVIKKTNFFKRTFLEVTVGMNWVEVVKKF